MIGSLCLYCVALKRVRKQTSGLKCKQLRLQVGAPRYEVETTSIPIVPLVVQSFQYSIGTEAARSCSQFDVLLSELVLSYLHLVAFRLKMDDMENSVRLQLVSHKSQYRKRLEC